MGKPSIAELLRVSGHTLITEDLVVRAVITLYGYSLAGQDARDWDAILDAADPLAASEAALVTMFCDQEFLLSNAHHLFANCAWEESATVASPDHAHDCPGPELSTEKR